jgi:hypothetical protein
MVDAPIGIIEAALNNYFIVSKVGEYKWQVNAGPDFEGKVRYVIFTNDVARDGIICGEYFI